MNLVNKIIYLFILIGLSKQDKVNNSINDDLFYSSTSFEDIISKVIETSTTLSTHQLDSQSEKIKRQESKVIINPYSSTKIYIIAAIGIVPAILGAFVYWLNTYRKSCFQNHPKSRLNIYTNISNCSSQNGLIKSKVSSSSLIRKRRIYSNEYPRKDLRLIEIIGEGNFGQVWKAKVNNLEHYNLVAVKTNKVDCNEEDWESLLQELNVMLQLGQHPNVVTLLGCCTERIPYFLILEYAENGKLLNYLRKYQNGDDAFCRLTFTDLVIFAFQSAKGMQFISSYGIIHRDLAARNVLVGRDKVCKIADFGLARSVNDYEADIYEQKTRGAMPLRWMAPESISMNIFTTKSDVWSFGILLWEIITLGSTPYPGLRASQVITNVTEGNIMTIPPVTWCSQDYYTLMKSCWSLNPNKRPNFMQIKSKLSLMISTSKNFGDILDQKLASYCNIIHSSPGEKV